MRSNPLLSIPGGVGFRVSWHPRHACYLPVSREQTRGPKMTTTGARTTGRERDPFFPLPLPRCLTRCLHRDYFPYSIPCPMGKRRVWVPWKDSPTRPAPPSWPRVEAAAPGPPLSHSPRVEWPPGRVRQFAFPRTIGRTCRKLTVGARSDSAPPAAARRSGEPRLRGRPALSLFT